MAGYTKVNGEISSLITEDVTQGNTALVSQSGIDDDLASELKDAFGYYIDLHEINASGTFDAGGRPMLLGVTPGPFDLRYNLELLEQHEDIVLASYELAEQLDYSFLAIQ